MAKVKKKAKSPPLTRAQQSDLLQTRLQKLEQEMREMRAVIDELTNRAPASEPSLTTQEAATYLGVSRPHVIKLVEQGELPCELVGTHRRLRRTDLNAYQRRRRERQAEAVTEIQRLGELYGI